ncbi:EAL domain-containing protein [uncultured Thiodictyon sp.]|uniref:putative bifunctional diguanylate cyclase/phosphodiesterase n=1 Tax=uncultured Thiodictyon sp. TaxID=1846217 RepID=UPI0034580DD1
MRTILHTHCLLTPGAAMADFRNIDDRSLADLLAAQRRESLDASDPGWVVQDLQIHQIELEQQNRELRAAQQALEESRDRYADLYDFAPVAYATLTRQGRITQMNLTAAQLLGVERGRVPDPMLGTRLVAEDGRTLLETLVRVLDYGDEETIEVTLGRPPAAQRALRLMIRRDDAHPTGEPATACRVILLDVTEHLNLTGRLKEREVQLEHLAQHDALTGLPNRLLFADRLQQAMLQAHREHRQVAVLFLDLDRFKAINNTLGHPAGDQVLRQTAQRMRDLMREGDTVARLGGDEFAILLGALEHGDDAGLVAQKLLASFQRPFSVEGQQRCVTASIGISLYPAHGDAVETLERNADAAMYRAKGEGRGTFRYYTEEMTALAFAQVTLEDALRQAIAKQEFVLNYQPQHHLETGAIVGCEAMLHWHHPLLGRIGPERFIPLAESSGLILPIGVWVVRTAAAQMRAWQERGLLADTAMWVKLFNRDSQHQNLSETIEGILTAVDLEPGTLTVEITETLAMTNPASPAGAIRHLHGLDIKIGRDAKNTGHPAPAASDRLAVHEFKLDRSFVAGIPGDPVGCSIARAAIALGRALGLRVVADGVETQAQADFLKAEGCRIGQGSLFSRALPATAFEAYVVGRAQ